MQTAIQLVAYDEPGLSGTMDAWADQAVPSWATVTYEAWITPTEDRSTWRQASDHSLFRPREAPQYKLRARNAAHDTALSEGHDVFIACDADAPPLSEKTLTNLLTPLRVDSASAVCANPICPTTPLGLFSNMGVYAKEAIGGIHGQCHAVSTGAWGGAGPFSDGVDHTELKSVWLEEEYRFGKRLRQYGPVEYVYDAPVYNDTRRRECRWRRAARKPTGDFCDRPGSDETFAPQNVFGRGD